MRLHKHWLDYDVAALAFVIVGIAATISSLGELGPRPAGAIFYQHAVRLPSDRKQDTMRVDQSMGRRWRVRHDRPS
jgi:hypothetical protein